jgi:fructose-bisphosphate aldolase class I
MNDSELMDLARALVAPEQGLLAMDESTSTCNRRLAAAGIPATEEMRRAYRELIVTTPGLNGPIRGAILFDETLHQTTSDGRRFVDVLTAANIIPGIKVDRGAKPLAGFPGEKVTDGLDGLRERLAEYRELGARFAKWRAVIQIGEGLPTPACVHANAHALARYAALCQEAGLVPIVEPEVLMEGGHTIERCFSATANALHALFQELFIQRVDVRAIVLKPNMILAGQDCSEQPSDEYVADLTVIGLMNTLPSGVPGVAFLSGGQSGQQACARLHQMNVRFAGRTPWALTFSFSRAIQYPALEIWGGREENVAAAQRALLHRAECAQAARAGRYDPVLEEAEVEARQEGGAE